MSEQFYEAIIYVEDDAQLSRCKQIFLASGEVDAADGIGQLIVETSTDAGKLITSWFMEGTGFEFTRLLDFLARDSIELACIYRHASDHGSAAKHYFKRGKKTTAKSFYGHLKKCSPEGDLYLSIRKGDIEAAKTLLSAGKVNANLRVGGMPVLFHLIGNGDLALVKAAVKAGASLDERATKDDWLDNIRVTRGCTALSFAVRVGNTPVINYLLSAGADVDAADDSGDAPINLAPDCEEPARIMEILAAGGANMNHENARGYTPLFHLVGDQVPLSTIHKAVELGGDVHHVNRFGGNIVWFAKGNAVGEAYVKSLNLGTVRRPSNAYDGTPRENIYRAIYKDDFDSFESLLAADAELNERDKVHITLEAGQYGRGELVRKMVELGVKPYSTYPVNGLPFYLHEQIEDPDIRNYLLTESAEYLAWVKGIEDRVKSRFEELRTLSARIRQGEAGTEILSAMVSDELKARQPLSSQLMEKYPRDNWERIAASVDREPDDEMRIRTDREAGFATLRQEYRGGGKIYLEFEITSGEFRLVKAC